MTGLDAFYRGKRVLVTGHTGFKGSWLCLWLAELGAEVHGYALAPPTTPSLFEEAGCASVLASHRTGDVRDFDGVQEALRAVRPEMVFHLAAQPLVRLSYRQARETYENNVRGTVNVLEAVRGVPSVRVCQVITSDKCCENRGTGAAFRESDPLGGFDPYSSSKGCAELVVAGYRRSFFPAEEIARHGVSVASARAGNVIGGGDWAADRIVPDCIRALQRGEPITVRHPVAVRPWQHVLEPLAGYLHLARCQRQDPAAFADAWNFGPLPTGCVTVRELVGQITRHWGEEYGSPRYSDSEAGAPVHEAALLRLDISKATARLGWHPVFTVPEAVAATVAWYRQRWRAGPAFDAAALCRRQIREFMDQAGTGKHRYAV